MAHASTRGSRIGYVHIFAVSLSLIPLLTVTRCLLLLRVSGWGFVLVYLECLAPSKEWVCFEEGVCLARRRRFEMGISARELLDLRTIKDNLNNTYEIVCFIANNFPHHFQEMKILEKKMYFIKIVVFTTFLSIAEMYLRPDACISATPWPCGSHVEFSMWDSERFPTSANFVRGMLGEPSDCATVLYQKIW